MTSQAENDEHLNWDITVIITKYWIALNAFRTNSLHLFERKYSIHDNLGVWDSVTEQGNSKGRTCLTVCSVFAWGLDITLKFLICYLSMI